MVKSNKNKSNKNKSNKNKSDTNNDYYPDIQEDNFLEKLYKKKEYYINRTEYPEENVDISDLCIKKSSGDFILQNHQKFVKNYINPNTPYKRLLLFWGTGVGKTCGAISIAEGFKESIKKYRDQGDQNASIYIISKENAKHNFIKELLGKCPKHKYVTKEELKKLNELKLKSKDPRVKEELEIYRRVLESRLTKPEKGGYYQFMAYQKFTNVTIGRRYKPEGKAIRDVKGKIVRQPRTTGETIDNLDNSLLIIDEAHMLNDNDWGEAVDIMIKKSVNLRVILLTATPIKNKPRELIQILNILLPIEQRINKRDVFKDKYTLTKDGLDIISKASKGYVSYIRGVDPVTFPERIDIGSILKPTDVSKDENFKYTKLIRCEMSKIHYATYKEYFDESKTHEMKRLVDMVLPNPDDSKIGLFKTKDLVSLKYASRNWKKTNKIETIDTKDRLIISGDIFKKSNLGKYSTKYLKVIENLENTLNKNSGPIFIYNENIRGIGLTIFEEILKRNGYAKYQDYSENLENIRCIYCGKSNHNSNIGHTYKPALFAILEGSTDVEDRNLIVDTFNNPENKDGSIIKFILGSSVTKESVDFKYVREIHILNFQWDISTIEQIIGRGVRHCSHYLLNKNQQNVSIYKYVSSIPSINGKYKISREEKYYLDAERTHIIIKKIERILKQTAVDCAINKYQNVFINEIKEYYNCGQKGNKECSLLCDYRDCDYKCSYEPEVLTKNKFLDKYRELKLNELNTKTYELNFASDEISRISRIIKKTFRKDIIFSLADIIQEIYNYADESDFIEEKYIYVALNNMIEKKYVIKNQVGDKGNITHYGKYYIFQALTGDESLDIDARRIPNDAHRIQGINLQNYINNVAKYNKEEQFDESAFRSFVKMKENSLHISRIIDKLSINQQIKVLEEVIININTSKLNVNKNELYSNYNGKILKHFNEIIITKDQIDTNVYSSSLYDTDAYSNPKKKIIGYYLKEQPRCYINGSWISCKFKITKEQINKFKENNIVVGFTEQNKYGKILFKIRLIENDQIDDRRKQSKGFVCKEMSNKKILIDIADKLKIDIKKKSIYKLCKIIELELRRRQQESIKNKKNIRWFYNHWELSKNMN
jgi:hypothetical protein